ncbi:Transcription factor IBH1 [Abeliophyllum distichum]|uniref:Transcription factor IBH1 n=1 Tax=Abeliophyllum distichum TaxID=126358 RepID=A0ABD1VXF6_9LAMI
MTIKKFPSNLSSVKSRFTYRFLQALKKMNKNRPASPSIRETYRRYHFIRVASYASMASVIRPRRAWSYATLWKIRNRALMKRSSRARSLTRNPRKDIGFEQVSDLRKLVPGGEEMKICRLLNETIHYIKCLEAQVEIMRNIVDHCST